MNLNAFLWHNCQVYYIKVASYESSYTVLLKTLTCMYVFRNTWTTIELAILSSTFILIRTLIDVQTLRKMNEVTSVKLVNSEVSGPAKNVRFNSQVNSMQYICYETKAQAPL